MRLSSPNGEHPDVVIEQGDIRIGSAPGNRVVIPDAGLSANHAVFRVDAHLQRLVGSARQLRLSDSLRAGALAEAVEHVAAEAGLPGEGIADAGDGPARGEDDSAGAGELEDRGPEPVLG